MLTVRLVLFLHDGRFQSTGSFVSGPEAWHRRCSPQIGMKLNDRLAKLRQQKMLAIEALRQAEAKASTRLRKQQNRAKIILGGALLCMPDGEREALLSMLLPHLTEHYRHFVTEHLAGEQASTTPENADQSHQGLN